jgi:hypothetical protein
MVSILYKNDLLAKKVSRVVDAARCISSHGLTLGRAGALFMDVTELMTEDAQRKVAISPEYSLEEVLSGLKGRYFYTTALKCSIEQYTKTPMDFSCIIRINDNCNAFEIIADNLIKFPIELSPVLKAYNLLTDPKFSSACFIHSYPPELESAMRKIGYDTKRFLNMAADFSPDQTWTFKNSFAVIEQEGNSDFEAMLSQALGKKTNVYIPRHGLYTFGIDSIAASDKALIINHFATLINRFC